MASGPTFSLQPGDPAPDFKVTATDGSTVTLSQFQGRPVILYFYPKDDTPGCTKEACLFRDEHANFMRKGAIVLGVSTDSVKSHQRFTEKYQLPFPLLADEDKTLVRLYGVWGPKTFMGRKFEGTHRSTFLIGPDGRIRSVWPQFKPDLHVPEILKAL